MSEQLHNLIKSSSRAPRTPKAVHSSSPLSPPPVHRSSVEPNGETPFEQYSFVQEDENNVAEVVILNEPALPQWMGSCHPNGSLYERPLDLGRAKEQHLNFRKELEKNGCVVVTVKEILAMDCDSDVVARVNLEDLASKCLTFKFNGSEKELLGLTEREKYLLSDEYKRECLSHMHTDQLVEVVLTNPTMHLIKQAVDTELMVTNYSFQPLVNLVFCRDQQITTCKGVVITALRSPIRAKETMVMKFCFNKLGVKVRGEIPAPGTLEGGDFFPCGKDLCMIGVGLRSNMYAVEYLLDNSLLGTRRVAIVKDYFDQSQQRMHLDTVFNIIAPKLCVVLETILGRENRRRRLVDEYVKAEDGKYYVQRHDIEFGEFLKGEGYHMIMVSEKMQENYGLNGLNLGNGRVLMVDRETSKHIARSTLFNGKMFVLDFEMMTAMYGSLHCCSQVISRKSLGTQKQSGELSYKLFSTIKSGNLQEIQSVISQGADPELSDYDHRTPLHLACSEGSLDVVTYLVNNLRVSVNIVDRWNNTPLDCAIRGNFLPVIDYLKKRNALTFSELGSRNFVENHFLPSAPVASPLVFNSTAKGVLVCPTNIYRNEETTEDNIFYIPEERWNEMIGKTGPRETRKEVLFEFANLHRILTQLGMEIYLFTHESFEETPDAVCVNDWFRSFPATGETPATLIIHPMKAPSRQREKFNPVLLSLLESTYKRFFNLTPCEQGDLKVSDSFHCKSTALNDAGDKKRYYLEAHTITLDRINNVGYCAVGKNVRASNEVKKIWKEITNYELVEFHLKNEEFYQKLHNTNFIFNMGTDWAIVCFEAISPEEQLIIRERLSKTKKLIISISKQQLTNFGAAGVLEVLSSNHKPAMLISTSAESALGAENVELLRGCVEVLHVVDVSALEYTCGGSLSSLLGFLY